VVVSFVGVDWNFVKWIICCLASENHDLALLAILVPPQQKAFVWRILSPVLGIDDQVLNLQDDLLSHRTGTYQPKRSYSQIAEKALEDVNRCKKDAACWGFYFCDLDGGSVERCHMS
jgi:hypothetical protein